MKQQKLMKRALNRMGRAERKVAKAEEKLANAVAKLHTRQAKVGAVQEVLAVAESEEGADQEYVVARLKLKLAKAKAPFASRADDSGTELKLWQDAGTDAKASSGSWYPRNGLWHGATLNTAVGKQAYTLTDRRTWLSLPTRMISKSLSRAIPSSSTNTA